MDYGKAYSTLLDSVTETMAPDELIQIQDAPTEEAALELLQGYLRHVQGERFARREQVGVLDAGAIGQHELVQSYERAGFSHEDAMMILVSLLTAPKSPDAY